MDAIHFNGDWEYEIELIAFAGFQIINGRYRSGDSDILSDGKMTLRIEDDLTDNPDPYPEQFEAIGYIFQNQEKIRDVIINRTLQELPEIIEIYGLQRDPAYANLTAERIRQLIDLGTIDVKIVSKNGTSYYEITGGCHWDDDHGLSFLMHNDRVVAFGGIDGNGYWDAVKDNGTYAEVSKPKQEKAVPKKYSAHPKYNTLKPSHQSANETFEHSLISGNHNELFKELVVKGEIDINGKWESQNKTFLEAACWFNNNEIVAFLLEKGAHIRWALHQCVKYNNNSVALELILQAGGDINQRDAGGDTILNIKAQQLARLYDCGNRSIAYKPGSSAERDDMISREKKAIKALIDKGADPNIANVHGYNAYSMARNLADENRVEILDFLNRCLR
ncbi:ankyrin repeat domain-containing protein [Chryseolinea soli]|uniref:DUF6985 domain-containing protein n=1 Tax=Chryseolinea soli TaxID=2321403 RepID=A0A385STV3_9BACT|nr:ankyrin repeat domain-containing protein [Chryseolinea soli]AYB33577.1 hypothetical protein D4L85_24640 [Chryseolinea soli]